ncbi:MAG TPA: hypothetical protein VGS96_09795 [Thermoanaerobaculia bacterium]|jgi:hypothetical protein|nr:hypothetical protein [Thermoanaerobaculia bacterium]
MTLLAYQALYALIQLRKLEPYASNVRAKATIMQGRVAIYSAARASAPDPDGDGLTLHGRLAAFVEDPLGSRAWEVGEGTLHPAHVKGRGLAWNHLWREARSAAVYGLPDAAMLLLDAHVAWVRIGGEATREYVQERLATLASRRVLRTKMVPTPAAPAPAAPAPVTVESPIVDSGDAAATAVEAVEAPAEEPPAVAVEVEAPVDAVEVVEAEPVASAAPAKPSKPKRRPRKKTASPEKDA